MLFDVQLPACASACGNKVVVYVHVHVRHHDATDWIEGRIADGFEFRNGKIVQFRSFLERLEAQKWAGIESSAASAI